MAGLQASGICLAYGERDVLKDVTITLASGDRCALAGANGSGKSSLMRILAGLARADSGRVIATSGCRVAYLPQSGVYHEGRTLREEVELAYSRFADLICRRDELAEQLATTRPDTEGVAALVEEHHAVEEQILHGGYYDREAQVDQVLAGLGFRPEDRNRPTSEFSGGWQMRIALAKILLQDPQFMLLDEPTNYLDLEARIWLGAHLAGYSGGVLIVSHDRRFLDQTVTAVWELFLAQVRRYRGSYTGYERRREEEIRQIRDAWHQQQEEIARIEDFIRRFRATASRARQVQSRIKQLEKMTRIEIPEHLKHITIGFPPPPRTGREVVTLQGVSRAYGDNRVLEDVDLLIERSQKIVLVGPNGAGKSTLMRIIGGQDGRFAGRLSYGAGVSTGYYADDDSWLGKAGVGRTLTGTSVLAATLASAGAQTEQRVRDMLGAFLFRGDEIYKDVAVLSGGERSRLAMLQLLLRPLNLLVLDEPTNHLDMTSKDVLLSALERYAGTIVFVSHDRQFIERLATRVVEIRSNRDRHLPSIVTDFPGDYHYYAWRMEQQAGVGTTGTAAAATAGPARSEAADSREQQRARRTRLQQLERELESLLARIEELEHRRAGIHRELSSPEVYGDGDQVRRRTAELDRVASEIGELTASWERASEEHAVLLSS